MTPLPFTRPTLGEEEFSAAREVLESGWITTGPRVVELERRLADYVGGDVEVRLFNSATSALEAVLIGAGIGPGHEVIVPAMTFVASANVVVRSGATPVFVDVDLRSRNLDAAAARPALNDRTRAIMPVHFAGMPVSLDPIYELAGERDILVLEDAAQAIGTLYDGRQIGSRGNPVVFSFHANKNMTTIEGGAVACRGDDLIRRLEAIRFHGIERDERGAMQVEEWGGKMNLPDIGAAIGLAQLKKLDDFNARRRWLAKRYFEGLPEHPALVLPADTPGHSWHMFCVCLDADAIGRSRESVIAEFRDQGIALGTHYPAVHLFGLYRSYGHGPGDFPVAERIGRQTLTLPLFPGMDEADVDRVCAQFRSLLDQA